MITRRNQTFYLTKMQTNLMHFFEKPTTKIRLLVPTQLKMDVLVGFLLNIYIRYGQG